MAVNGAGAGEWPMDAIAVVGVGLRLPGGIATLDGLWEALREGRDLVGKVPADRFDSGAILDPVKGRPGKAYTDDGGFLDQDISLFDADFFGISPKEASRLDPQHRLLLECAVEALDDAAIDMDSLAGGDAAVIMGLSGHDYETLQNQRPRTISAYTMSGNFACNAANRVSYFLDVSGPSFALDTACSSSLTAIHQACEALRTGRSPLALAGAVNLMACPLGFIAFSAASMGSPSGRCQPFSANADGFVRAEGAGVLVLKPYAAALRDGDRVHGLVLASGVNADGRTSSLTVPGARTQASLLERVYAEAGIEADDVCYVEAHGTGTPVGDPIECRAIGETLGRRRTGAPLPIGSIKSNIGHMEAGAGMAGVLKALLVLRNGQIPATLHADRLNPAIDFDGLGLEPVTAPRTLPADARRIAGVNSFGFGGANGHVVLAVPDPQAGEPAVREHGERPATLPVLVSARSPRALAAAAREWADWLTQTPDQEFHDTAYTATLRRGRHPHRMAVLAGDAQEAARKLSALAQGEEVDGGAAAAGAGRGKVGFVFSGNGSQWAGMGRDLLDADPAFAAEVAAVDAELAPRLGWSVLAEMTGPDPMRWDRTEVAQPMLFAVQAGVVAALAARGVRPAAVTGHSVGEVAAAYCAGILDRAAACRVIAERSAAQATTAGAGRMAAVGLAPADAERRLAAEGLSDLLTVAGVNSPQDVTLAGSAEALAGLGNALKEEGVFFRDLGLDYAFHSPAMDPARDDLLDALDGLDAAPGRIPLVSTVTGRPADGPRLDALYWWRNIREPVRFAEAVALLTAVPATGGGPEQQGGEPQGLGCDVLVEVGPHPVLSTYLRRVLTAVSATADHDGTAAAVTGTLSRTGRGAAALDTATATVIAAGAELDWDRLFPAPRRVVDLPAYPWQRDRHWNGDTSWWLEESRDEDAAETGPAPHPLLGRRDTGPEPVWTHRIEHAPLAYLQDHKVGEAVVMPAAAFIDMALAAGRQVHDGPVEIDRLTILRALTLPFDDPDMNVRLHTAVDRAGSFTTAARTGAGSGWSDHVRGRVRRLLRPRPPAVDVPALRARLTESVPVDEHYAICARTSLFYGPAFQPLTGMRHDDREVLAEYTMAVDPQPGHVAHPTVLDGAIQACLPAVMRAAERSLAYLPKAVATVRCWSDVPAQGLVHVRVREVNAQQAVLDVTMLDAGGAVALELCGLVLERFSSARLPEPQRLDEVLRAAPLPGPAEPSPLPSPAAVMAARAEPMRRLLDTWQDRDSYAEGRWVIRRVAAHYALAAVQRILAGPAAGPAGTSPGTSFGIDDLVAAGVQPVYAKLLRLMLREAAEHGLVTSDGGRWTLTTEPAPEPILQDAVIEYPSEGISWQALAVCGRNLADVLRGDRDPVELLFSEADALIERHYDGLPVTQYHNRLMRELVAEIAERFPADRPLRVLEVGAGTGGTTAVLLDALPPERTHYTYTDISSAFFARARQRFADHDFLHYRPLDLNRNPLDQDFVAGSYDLVIAANMLHATDDLKATLRRIAHLLADGGQLLVLESHEPALLAPFYGLLTSFWGTTDTGLRPDHPLLPHGDWAEVLHDCDFTGTVQTGDPSLPWSRDLSVMLTARAPRGRETAPPPPPPAGRAPGRIVVADLTSAGAAPGGAPDEADWARRYVRELTDVLAGAGHHGRRPETVPPAASPEEWSAAWERALAGAGEPVDVVLLSTGRPADPPAEQTRQALGHMTALQAIARAERPLPGGSPEAGLDEPAVRVWLVCTTTADDYRYPPAMPGARAAAWGAARTMASEHPDIQVRRIAVAPADPATAPVRRLAEQTLAEMRSASPEDEVVLTGPGRFVHRARHLPAQTRPSDAGGYALDLQDQGNRYRLAWRSAPIPAPRPGEVVVEIEAVGLNQRDLRAALGTTATFGLERGDAGGLGLDFAGTVIATGGGVTALAPGDRVAGIAPGCLASHVAVPARNTCAIPDGMTSAEAATLPLVSLTVQECLRERARLRAGETLLVHGAAGGVGLAALQYARHVGARVIATAGTPAKRDLLRALGVHAVLDSRSLDFADQVMDLTGGHGVDVVLNRLAGEARRRGLEVLKPRGRFVEIGGHDGAADGALPLERFGAGRSFFAVDVLQERLTAADAGGLRDVADALESGVHRPLPFQTFPAARVQQAFARLQQPRHAGKIVVTFGEPVPLHRTDAEAVPELRADRTYLITGGLSGLGAATARHLAARGARHLALLGRRGLAAPEAPGLLADLAGQGVQAIAHAVDVTDAATMARIVAEIDASPHPLGGVVHSAMVLHDAPFTSLTTDQIERVLAPKMTGGLILDELTREHDLDFFIAYTSVSSLVNNPNQAPYLAANLALEAMVRDRRRAGAAALAVAWGGIDDVGYVHRTMQETTKEFLTRGVELLPVKQAMAELDRAMTCPEIPVVTTGHFDFAEVHLIVHTLTAPRTAHLVPARRRREGSDQLQTALATSGTDAVKLVEDTLADLLAQVLQTTPDRIDRTRRIDQLGLDSLMGADFSSLLNRQLGCQIAVVEVLGIPNLTALAQRILVRLGHETVPADAVPPQARGNDLESRPDAVGAAAPSATSL
ncbi:L-histidine N(alpha)-methyltransferase [Actinomadura sp. 21ATH]|uniref:L-histidine N(alpha)-methyltransferase n=1 Tax=Actinomadura sp. 21ATH TaxID=1735444 RepID=UPI0035C12397